MFAKVKHHAKNNTNIQHRVRYKKIQLNMPENYWANLLMEISEVQYFPHTESIQRI